MERDQHLISLTINRLLNWHQRSVVNRANSSKIENQAYRILDKLQPLVNIEADMIPAQTEALYKMIIERCKERDPGPGLEFSDIEYIQIAAYLNSCKIPRL